MSGLARCRRPKARQSPSRDSEPQIASARRTFTFSRAILHGLAFGRVGMPSFGILGSGSISGGS